MKCFLLSRELQEMYLIEILIAKQDQGPAKVEPPGLFMQFITFRPFFHTCLFLYVVPVRTQWSLGSFLAANDV